MGSEYESSSEGEKDGNFKRLGDATVDSWSESSEEDGYGQEYGEENANEPHIGEINAQEDDKESEVANAQGKQVAISPDSPVKIKDQNGVKSPLEVSAKRAVSR